MIFHSLRTLTNFNIRFLEYLSNSGSISSRKYFFNSLSISFKDSSGNWRIFVFVEIELL